MVSWAAAWRALCVMTGVRTSKSSMLALTEVLCQGVASACACCGAFSGQARLTA